VLESGTVHRIGGEEPIVVDVRVLAATNRPPAEAVRERQLREDLYYRLNVFPIALPPLRERGGDVDLLATHFLEQLNQARGTTKRLAPAARDALARHHWPGNVRELWNVVQRAYLLAGDEIDARCLPPDLDGGAPAEAPASGDGVPVGATLDEMERRMILATLRHCGGDKKAAARMLGISLKTLYNRLNIYAAGSPGGV
jgi:two-component system response regulator AtoC